MPKLQIKRDKEKKAFTKYIKLPILLDKKKITLTKCGKVSHFEISVAPLF